MTLNRREKLKLGLVRSSTEALWGSCKSISENLGDCYFRLAKNSNVDVEIFLMDDFLAREDLNRGTGYLFEIAQRIRDSQITTLIFVDHNLDPEPILTAIIAIDPYCFRKIPIVFHIFGDFTFYHRRWFRIGQKLMGHPVKLVCASQRQRDFVRFFAETQSRDAVSICAFPVDTDFFSYSPILRNNMRASLQLSEEDVFVFYSGRISFQKGVFRLIEEFNRAVLNGRRDLVLGIAGAVDEQEITLGNSMGFGYVYHRLQEVLRDLPAETRRQLRFFGQKPADELHPLYCAADLFTSLSLYHDEDFGMAPAEALSTGVRAVLTDWGGYSSFAIEGVDCTLLYTCIDSQRGLSVNYDNLRRNLMAVKSSHSDDKRAQSAHAFARSFSIETTVGKLEQLLFKDGFIPFSGFRPQLSDFSRQLFAPDWLGENSMVCNPLYGEAYARYASESNL